MLSFDWKAMPRPCASELEKFPQTRPVVAILTIDIKTTIAVLYAKIGM